MPVTAPPVEYIDVTRRTYASLGYPPYRWVHSESAPPWAPPSRPLAESRVALVASGGIYVRGQIAFHFKDDTSYRLVPTDVDSRVDMARRGALLRAALATLPEEQAQVLVNNYFEGRSMRELAEQTGVPLGTVKSRARMAMPGRHWSPRSLLPSATNGPRIA